MSGWYIHGKLASQEQEAAELALALAEASSLLYDPHLLDLGPDHFVQVSLHRKILHIHACVTSPVQEQQSVRLHMIVNLDKN